MRIPSLLSHILRRLRAVSPLAVACVTLAALAAPVHAQPKAAAATPAAAPAVKPETVLAKVDGRPITWGDVAAFREQLGPQAQMVPPETLLPQILEQLVNRELVAGRARKDKVNEDAEYKRQLAYYETRLLQQVWLVKQIEAKVTEASLKSAYDARVKSEASAEEVKASHILLRSEAEAKEVIAALAKGQSFAKLAAERSTDPSAKANAGDLGWFSQDKMVKAFADAAFAMKKGETSAQPVQSEFGYHVIRVEDRRKAAAPSYDELEPELRDEQAAEVIRALMADLRKDAKVETFTPDGKPVTPDAKPAK